MDVNDRLSSDVSLDLALRRWFLIFTKPAGESVAQMNLERQGYRVYYPRLSQPALYRGRWSERVVSLFPRYVFLQLDPTRQSLAPVRSTIGVAGLVSFGREPTLVPNTIVEGLMDAADPVTGLHKIGENSLRPGSRISVIAGAFRGLEGIFERNAGEERVVILLRLLGRDATVQVPSGYIVPADDYSAKYGS